MINDNTSSIRQSSMFQEFAVVDPFSISSFKIVTLASFGDENISLRDPELFQTSCTVFANDTLNKQSCNSDSDYQVVSSTLSLNIWLTNNSDTGTSLMTKYIPNPNSTTTEVQFNVDIQNGGV